ncbi:MAG: dephospho-CoA kinase [Bryobacteraceae bacterium]
MLIAGLTGGLACGKSFVAAAFQDLGCEVVEADALGHEVMLPEGEAYPRIVAEFGPEILNHQETIDRPRLAALVFADPAALERLNAIVHPAVQQRAARLFREIGERDPHAIVIYVAAILIETGGYRQCDKLIVVCCTREQQIERAMHRPDATMTDVLARLARQLPVEKKREFADYVIDTTGTKEDTLRQTKIVYEDLRTLES